MTPAHPGTENRSQQCYEFCHIPSAQQKDPETTIAPTQIEMAYHSKEEIFTVTAHAQMVRRSSSSPLLDFICYVPALVAMVGLAALDLRKEETSVKQIFPG